MRSKEYQKRYYLKWKENNKLRKAGLLPPPFKATSEEEIKQRKLTLQKERRCLTPRILKPKRVKVKRVKMTEEQVKAKHLERQKLRREKVKALKPIKIVKPRKLKVIRKPEKIIKRLETVNHDLSQMIAVYIPERKMTVYVKKGRDIEQVKLKWKL